MLRLYTVEDQFEDPGRAVGNEAELLEVFRRVRDGIDQRIRQWLKQA
jgi:hypothetical protein